MKKTLTLFIIALLAANSAVAQRFVIQQNCEVFKDCDGIENGYAYVDLGLSGGLKWATCNVGAENPWDYGDYFAWGETVGYGKEDRSNANNYTYNSENGNATYVKTYYSWYTAKYDLKEKYSSGRGNLDFEDDAAHVNMGGSWRMPTYDEWRGLLNGCYWEWTDNYNGKGVSGHIVYKAKDASDKGKVKYGGSSTTTVGTYSLADPHIFLPAAGYRFKSDLYNAGYNGEYCSSSLSGDNDNTGIYIMYMWRSVKGLDDEGQHYYGYSVRGVVK